MNDFALPPKIFHEFKESEMVRDMTVIKEKKHWFSRTKEVLYIATDKGIYKVEAK